MKTWIPRGLCHRGIFHDPGSPLTHSRRDKSAGRGQPCSLPTDATARTATACDERAEFL